MEKTPNSSNKSAQPEFIDMDENELLQYAIDMDGGLYDQALAVDAYESRKAQESLQKSAYETYSENIKATKQRERQDKIERIDRVAKRSLKLIGNVAILQVSPIATEFIQRRTAHKKLGEKYIQGLRSETITQRYDYEKNKFQGSVDDFKKINEEIKIRKEQERVRRKAQRHAFFE